MCKGCFCSYTACAERQRSALRSPRLRRGRPFFACEKSAPHNIRLNSLILTQIINRTPNRRPLVPIAAICIRRAGTRRERPDCRHIYPPLALTKFENPILFLLIRRAGRGRERPDYILFIRRAVEPKAEISEYKLLPPPLTRNLKSGLPLPFIPPVYFPPPSPPRRPCISLRFSLFSKK